MSESVSNNHESVFYKNLKWGVRNTLCQPYPSGNIACSLMTMGSESRVAAMSPKEITWFQNKLDIPHVPFAGADFRPQCVDPGAKECADLLGGRVMRRVTSAWYDLDVAYPAKIVDSVFILEESLYRRLRRVCEVSGSDILAELPVFYPTRRNFMVDIVAYCTLWVPVDAPWEEQ